MGNIRIWDLRLTFYLLIYTPPAKDLVRYLLGREGVSAPGGPTFLPSDISRVINIAGHMDSISALQQYYYL